MVYYILVDTVEAHSGGKNPEACIVTTSFTPSFYSALSRKFDKKKTIVMETKWNLKVWSVKCQMLETDENE